MDTTPASHRSEPRLRSKSASRLARIGDSAAESEELPHLTLDLVPTSLKKTPTRPHISLQTSNSLPFQELLLLSPSPLRRSKARLMDRPEMAEEPIEHTGSRRRCKSRATSMALLGCSSPRNNRRARRRLEQDIRDEKDASLAEEIGKARKRRQSSRSRKEKLSLVPSVPSSTPSPKTCDDDQSSLDCIGQLILELILWKDVAKSSLWFGFGSLFFLSSSFTRGLHFSIFSVISQVGLLFLGASFFFNTFSQRDNDDQRKEFRLKEDDIARAARVMLPAVNLVIAKTRELFSGDPSMTLKVAPLLLFGAKYGHLITFWRHCATGFFISFTVPKLYSCYSVQLNRQVEYLGCWVWEAWKACSHKKIVAASAATVFWNLSTVKTRIFAAFIFVVIIRYFRQHSEVEEVESEQGQPQALVIVEEGSHK